MDRKSHEKFEKCVGIEDLLEGSHVCSSRSRVFTSDLGNTHHWCGHQWVKSCSLILEYSDCQRSPTFL